MSVTGKVITSLLALVALFCLIVLVWGGCTGQTFIEVLQSWLPAKEAAKTFAQIMSAINLACFKIG